MTYLILFATTFTACLVQAQAVRTAGRYVTKSEWALVLVASTIASSMCSLIAWALLQ